MRAERIFKKAKRKEFGYFIKEIYLKDYKINKGDRYHENK